MSNERRNLGSAVVLENRIDQIQHLTPDPSKSATTQLTTIT